MSLHTGVTNFKKKQPVLPTPPAPVQCITISINLQTKMRNTHIHTQLLILY